MNNIKSYIDTNLTHQIHTSERRAFRACRRRWNWIYNEMYYPIVTPEPLEFGIAIHKAMEHFYEPKMWFSPLDIRRDIALVAFRQECEKHLTRYKKLNPDPDVEILNSYKERIDLGLGMLKYYFNQMSPIYDQDFTPIRVEVPFEVPVEDPSTDKQLWCKCDSCWQKFKNSISFKDILINAPESCQEYDSEDDLRNLHWLGLPVTYAGRLDMLAEDSFGRYWIVDWKTTSRMLDEDAEASFLQLDDQISSYCWALSKLGISVAGFVYVEIKKTFPRPPELLKRTYQGRAYSTAHANMTTYSMALRTFQQNDNDAWQMGLYDEYLNWLMWYGPKFTQRYQIHKNENEIRNVGIDIALEAMDIIGQPRIYPQPGRFSCNKCLFKQPCIGKNMGEDYQYTLDTLFEVKKYHYYAEREASTE